MKEGWEYKKLGEVAIFINGDRGKNYPSQKDFVEKGIPFINAGHIKDNIVDFGSMNYISKEKFLKLGSGKIQNGDILFCLRGSLGKKAIVNNISEGAIASSLVIIRVTKIINAFLSYFLDSPTIKREIYKSNNGSSQPNLSAKSVSDFVIPLPSEVEQQYIVEELDLLSSIIEKKKAQLKELDNLAQSLFYEMFGDPITNEKGWEVIRLGDKCSVSSFKRVLIEDVVDKGIPFIRGTELMALANGDDVDFTLFITPEHYEVVKEISDIPKIGDLLIPSINAKGCIWIVNTDHPRYYKDGRVLWVHVDANSYTSETLKFIMSLLIKETYSAVASGATFAELKLFVLRDLQTILPPLPLQQQFASKIEAIERQKELIKQSIKEVETLFNSRMDYYFS